MSKLIDRIFGNKADIVKEKRLIKVRFPSDKGDEERMITVQQLKKEYKDYLIIDPSVGEQVDLEKLANLDIDEVVAMPPIVGG